MSGLKSKIDKIIDKLFGLNAEIIKSLVSPAIGIKLEAIKSSSSRNVLYDIFKKESSSIRSKIGGLPEVKKDFEWPHISNKPLSFLCQINLGEISIFQSELPKSGVLYFFVANENVDDFINLENNTKVIYEKEINSLREKVINQNSTINEFSIGFYEYYTIPSYQEKIITVANFDESVTSNLWEFEDILLEKFSKSEGSYTSHHILGDPNAVQGSVRGYWGSKYLDPLDFNYKSLKEKIVECENIGQEFKLLLQIDLQDNRIDLANYGDNCLYFGIHRESLKKLDFEDVKLVIQST